jgi:hypothetical protein
MAKQMKDCRNVERRTCDRQLPAGSKSDFCRRCRRYDDITSQRPADWLRHRYMDVTRWRCSVVAHGPKDVQKAADEAPVRLRPRTAQIRQFPVPARRTNDAQMRKRA